MLVALLSPAPERCWRNPNSLAQVEVEVEVDAVRVVVPAACGRKSGERSAKEWKCGAV
jgi:hypothetical protein